MQFTNWSGADPCVLVCVSVLWSVSRRHGDFLINCLNFSFVSTWHHYQFIFGYHPFLGQFTNVQALSAFVRPENIFLQQISYFLNSVFCFCWPRKYISSTDFIFLEVLCFCWQRKYMSSTDFIFLEFSALPLLVQNMYFFNRFLELSALLLLAQKKYFINRFHIS